MIIQGKFTHLDAPVLAPVMESMTYGGRHYETQDGTFPSVTTVVGHEKKKFFASWRRDNPREAARTMRRGQDFHLLIERYILNDEIDMDEIDPGQRELFNLLKPKLDLIDNVRGVELAMWSSMLGLAGRTDLIAEYDGKLSVIDYKAVTRCKTRSEIMNYFEQETAYVIMAKERFGWTIEQIVTLIASEDGVSRAFIENPLDHVISLKNSIDKYQRETADA